MDVSDLKKCKNHSDFNELMMDDITQRFDTLDTGLIYKEIAIVELLERSDINTIKAFFDIIQEDLGHFLIGDATSIKIDGQRYVRYFLFSDQVPAYCMQFPDGVFRWQSPEVEQIDGVTIDLKALTITFKNDGEVLEYASEELLESGLKKILAEYWSKYDYPDVRINDSISENPGTKWIIESFSDFLMSLYSQEERITLVRRLEGFIPELEFELSPKDYLPYSFALQLATHMNTLDQSAQQKVYSSLTLVFGLFDDYRTDLDD